METNVLSIKIVRNHTGFTDLFEYNPNPFLSNCIDDLRTLLMKVDNLNGRNAAVILTNHKEGSIITLATWLGGVRGDESISAWIYVPNNIRISGGDLASIVEVTKNELTSTKRHDARLIELFSKKYDVENVTKPVFVTEGNSNAYRYYGHDASTTLASILENLHQPYYEDYSKVFILDYSANLSFSDGKDLTSKPILAKCLLEPPGSVEGYTAYIDNAPIVNPKYYTEGDEIRIEWQRPGFNTVPVQFSATPGMYCMTPERSEMKMICSFDSVVVKNESGESIEGYKIKINTLSLLPNVPVSIHIDHISKTKIEIEANGYEDYSQVHDLSSGRIKVFMKKGIILYKFLFPNKDNGLWVEHKAEKELDQSPFTGYVIVGRSKDDKNSIKLKYSPFTMAMKVKRCLLSVFLLVIGLAGGWFAADYYNENLALLDGIEDISTSEVSDSTAVNDTTIKLDNISDPAEVKNDGQQLEQSENKSENQENASNDKTEETKK